MIRLPAGRPSKQRAALLTAPPAKPQDDDAAAVESESLTDRAAPRLPAGVPGAAPEPTAASEAAEAWPDGPNVEASPWELDAARGKLPDDSR
jgi:hypothetical protein